MPSASRAMFKVQMILSQVSKHEAQLGRLYSFGVASAAPPFLSTGKGLRNRGFGKRSHFGESLCPCPVFANLVMFQVTVDRLGTRQNIPAPSHPVQAEVHLQKGGEIKVFRQLEIRDLSPGCLLLICILMSLGNALRDFSGC